MTFDPPRHHRRSLRLQGYDYSQIGTYFVTACTHHRQCLFGQVVEGAMVLNETGLVVEAAWRDLPHHHPCLELDTYVVMPNHVHGLLVLTGSDATEGLQRKPLSEILRAFKTFSARRIHRGAGSAGQTVWQRNYYEHIVRSQNALERIRAYIATNPARWAADAENPERRGAGHRPAPTP